MEAAADLASARETTIIVLANRNIVSLEVGSTGSDDQLSVVIRNIFIERCGSRDIVIGSGSRASIVVKADCHTDELVIDSISIGRDSRATFVISGHPSMTPVVGKILIGSNCHVAFDTSSGSHAMASVIGNISIESGSCVSLDTASGSHAMSPVIGSIDMFGSRVFLKSSSRSPSAFPLIGTITMNACQPPRVPSSEGQQLFVNCVVLDSRVSFGHRATIPSSANGSSYVSREGIRAALEDSHYPRSGDVDPIRAAPLLAKRRRNRDSGGGGFGECALDVQAGRHQAILEGAHGAAPLSDVEDSTCVAVDDPPGAGGIGASPPIQQEFAAKPHIGHRALARAHAGGSRTDGTSSLLSRPRHLSSSVVNLIGEDDDEKTVVVSSSAGYRMPPFPSLQPRNSAKPSSPGGSALPAVVEVKDTHEHASNPKKSDRSSNTVENVGAIDLT